MNRQYQERLLTTLDKLHTALQSNQEKIRILQSLSSVSEKGRVTRKDLIEAKWFEDQHKQTPMLSSLLVKPRPKHVFKRFSAQEQHQLENAVNSTLKKMFAAQHAGSEDVEQLVAQVDEVELLCLLPQLHWDRLALAYFPTHPHKSDPAESAENNQLNKDHQVISDKPRSTNGVVSRTGPELRTQWEV